MDTPTRIKTEEEIFDQIYELVVTRHSKTTVKRVSALMRHRPPREMGCRTVQLNKIENLLADADASILDPVMFWPAPLFEIFNVVTMGLDQTTDTVI